ncbi:hypothetical protein LTR91_020472 [Friedmanniomyces endolithicus]|uniref:DUF2231 domain-containing protein n=1 Tax=Friedmanniomyces endolithicus TaxID=329885 RepID=A0AAN6HE51_9PEZI|nr:hypothetical protein LTR35_008134 [Friedmanniomyces endolithicus]KAK0282156.1 hypothetical protein LTS00_012271 [Friedmanniomyces endolithicus]KAK0327457.1 hypothetical protein LTR82_000972 [Friedmanniomyces endolithicus]KAK0353658.1 hypothetical protein LTR94_015682 [Friedmanniomyces endolithicus]KAK0796241.1 hypothetical protein LTR59_007204 [Friedmanniomyces endolithicus]
MSDARARSRSLLSDELKASLKPAPPPRMQANINTTEPKNPLKKPIHPAVVHMPIAFISLAVGLDLANFFSASLPNVISASLPIANDATRASYFLLSLGLLFSIPAVTTGVGEAKKAIDKQGLYEKDGKTIKQKFKGVIAHAIANDIVILVMAYIWYCRRSAAKQTLLGKVGLGSVSTAEAAYAPAMWMVVVEAMMGALQLFSANIGGSLTYNYGFGMAIGGGGKKAA